MTDITTDDLWAKVESCEGTLADTRAEYKSVEERLKTQYKRYEKALGAYLRTKYPSPVTSLTPEQYRELCQYNGTITVAHEIVKEYFDSIKPLRYGSSSCWRGEQYKSETYATPEVSLKRNEDPTEHANRLREYAKLVGEAAVHVSIFENSLSAHGIYAITYTVDTDEAELHKTTYGRQEELFTGPLERVLALVARSHYYDPNEPQEEDY